SFDNEALKDNQTRKTKTAETAVSKKGRKHVAARVLKNFAKGIDEIGKANRKAFGLIYSTFDTMQEHVMDGAREINKALQISSPTSPSSPNIMIKNIDLVTENMREV
ncbi:hypothetical protein RFI_36081, partial [Reticulomyxa filosa]